MHARELLSRLPSALTSSRAMGDWFGNVLPFLDLRGACAARGTADMLERLKQSLDRTCEAGVGFILAVCQDAERLNVFGPSTLGKSCAQQRGHDLIVESRIEI